MSHRSPLTLDQSEEGTQSVPPYEPLGQVSPPPASDYQRDLRRTNAQWTARVIYFVFGVIEIAIAVRMLLKLIAANEASGFARFTYGLTALFVAPFQNVVNSPRARNGSTFELSSILALLIYILFSWLIVRLLFLLLDRPTLD